MTKDEAIQVLQTALTAPFIYGNYAKALEMAIEALCREQKEEDLAKDIARRMATIIENEQDMRVILKNASAELLKDGTLKVNVKSGAEVNRVLVWGDDGCGGLYYADDRASGEWIYDGVRIASDEESRLYWKCSECGHEGNPDANYCGFCGAKMGGKER